MQKIDLCLHLFMWLYSQHQKTLPFVYMLLFAHISHLLDHIYQYLWYGYSNDSVHHEHDQDFMSDFGYLAALFIALIYITPCAGI